MKRYLFLLITISMLAGCSKPDDLDTVAMVDINRYMGKWYEIARLPNSFEEGLICITAEYSISPEGDITVVNRGYDPDGKGSWNEVTGKAWIPDTLAPGKLKVQFFWPFAGDYYIMHLDTGYQHALIGDPSRKFLWVLSRTASLPEETIRELLDIANSRGFETQEVIKVDHECGM
jgi:apolipoprotein D and lipocalin family protein